MSVVTLSITNTSFPLQLRLGLEQHFKVNLKKYKRVIDEQMVTIMGQVGVRSLCCPFLTLNFFPLLDGTTLQDL